MSDSSPDMVLNHVSGDPTVLEILLGALLLAQDQRLVETRAGSGVIGDFPVSL